LHFKDRLKKSTLEREREKKVLKSVVEDFSINHFLSLTFQSRVTLILTDGHCNTYEHRGTDNFQNEGGEEKEEEDGRYWL